MEINYSKNVETGRYFGPALVGTSKDFDGPPGSEVEANIAALVEWYNTGITDVGAIVGVDANGNDVSVVGAKLNLQLIQT